jgi:hypothetical protein
MAPTEPGVSLEAADERRRPRSCPRPDDDVVPAAELRRLEETSARSRTAARPQDDGERDPYERARPSASVTLSSGTVGATQSSTERSLFCPNEIERLLERCRRLGAGVVCRDCRGAFRN